MNAWSPRSAAALSLAVLSWGCALAPGAPTESKSALYYQVVHGSDGETAPAPDAKAIGPKLRKRLEDVFRWKNYWEVKRGQFEVEAGKTTKVDVSDQRRLEVSFVGKDGLQMRMFKGGKLVRTTREKRSMKFTLVGGDDDRRQSWFIILRKDKPSTAE